MKYLILNNQNITKNDNNYLQNKINFVKTFPTKILNE